MDFLFIEFLKNIILGQVNKIIFDFFEINEAYASVILSLQQLLSLDLNRVNVNGGAVALGHPIGASGARILVTLIQVLKQNKARYGLASICNGGGASTTVIIENL